MILLATSLFTLNTNNKKNKVVGMPGVQQVKVIISQPNSFEQSEEICEHLKEKKSIIVNLEYVNKDVARRSPKEWRYGWWESWQGISFAISNRNSG